jgi:hypothetical protein
MSSDLLMLIMVLDESLQPHTGSHGLNAVVDFA